MRSSGLTPIFLGLFCLAQLLGSCANAPTQADREIAAHRAEAGGLADRLYVRMQAEYVAERYGAALSLAYEILDHHAEFFAIDHVLQMAVGSSAALHDQATTLKLSREFMSAYPDSPHLAEVLDTRAAVLEGAGDHRPAADTLVRLYDTVSKGYRKAEVQDRLAHEVGFLDVEDLGRLRESYPNSALAPYLGYLWLEALLDAERNRDANALLSQMRREYPGDPWLGHAEQLLLDPTYEAALTPEPLQYAEGLEPRLIGVLCPLTGRYTVLGNAFFDGVRMAKAHAERVGWRRFALSIRDTEGDPVTAAMLTRVFAEEEQPIALIGGLLSAPTVAAALVSDSRGIPLISPTATNERIADLGPNIFQTNVTRLFEARLMARLVVNVLLKERIAVLYPDSPEGLRNYEVFAAEVIEAGGLLVEAQAFNTGLTDFRGPLKTISEALPQVIYVPADVDQMLMLGPQLDFYRAGALILGPSIWNSTRLLEKVGSVLERAIFPSDTAFYPPAWDEDFLAEWDGAELPREATAIARQSYMAAMFLFRALGEGDIEERAALRDTLTLRLDNRRETEITPENLSTSLRMFRNGMVVHFPMELFAETLAWEDTLKARADTLGVLEIVAPLPEDPTTEPVVSEDDFEDFDG